MAMTGTDCVYAHRARLRARQASDASAAWSRERRGLMRARGIEGVGATPVHRSAVSRPGLHPGEVIAQSGMARVHEPRECGSMDTLRGYVRDAEIFKRHAGEGLL